MALGDVHSYDGKADAESAPTQRWRLHMRGLRHDADGTTVVAVAPALGAPEGALADAPIQLLRLGADCRQVAYAWRQGTDLAQARQVQERLATFDFALPARNGEVVKGDARDGSGRYRFAAVRNRTGDQTLVQRRILGYHHTKRMGAGLLVDGPGLRVTLGDDFWPVRAQLDQTIALATGDVPAQQVHASLTAATGEGAARLDSVDPDSTDWVWGNLLADAALRDAARLGDDPRLHGMPAAEVLRLLSDADPQGEHLEAALRQLHAWLLANPDGAAQLRVWLQGRAARYSDDTWARLALAALSRASTPAARLALRQLAQQDGLPSAMRLHALLNLATAEGIDASDVAAVRALAAAQGGDPAGLSPNAALSALGAMARSDGLDAAERTGIVRTLRGELQGQADSGRLVAAVNGAGNAAAGELLPELKALGGHAEIDVRRRVADALHALPQEAVQPQADWLAGWLQSESAPQVAASLVATLRLQWPATAALPQLVLDTAKARLLTERNAAVAVQLATLLGSAAGQSPVARQALLDRFAQEFRRGDAADAAVLQAIGAYVDAKSLMGAM